MRAIGSPLPTWLPVARNTEANDSPDMEESTDRYLVPAGTGTGQLREKMSRFIGFVYPVSSAADARETVKRVQNEYHDARHVCWAYVLRPDRSEYQSNDNGEPSGTAGRPILGQINSAGLTDTLVVVVRYFGGIKLGTPGLIAAYREAARLAIENAGVSERTVCRRLSVEYPYELTGDVMRIVKGGRGLRILGQEYGGLCRLFVELPATEAEALRGRLGGIYNVEAKECGE